MTDGESAAPEGGAIDDAPMPEAERRVLARSAVALGLLGALRWYGASLAFILALAALSLVAAHGLLLVLQWLETADPFGSVVASLLEPGPLIWAAIGLPTALIAGGLYRRFSSGGAYRSFLDMIVNWAAPKLGLGAPSHGGALAARLWALRRCLRAAAAAELVLGLALLLFAASALSWGLARALGAEALFAGRATGADAASFGGHLLFWIWHVADLLLLEAPSAFGRRFGALEARPGGYSFLTLVLVFRISIIHALVRSLPFLLGKALTPTAPTPERYSTHVERVLPEFWAYQAQSAAQETAQAATRSAQS